MTPVREGLPEGRYGRSADARADRTLKIVGAVLGAGLLALVSWFGYAYITGEDVSGRVLGYKVTGSDAVEVRLEVIKDRDTTGVCTVRTLAKDHAEVGRKDFTFDQREDELVKVVTVRTTGRATNAELVGCESGPGR
ncbi:DUF4307 domain-containing protein [Streptomyces sp. NPDC048636]|uniref:DUF4307 domain-containing protein n=1 Tax=Streptomyces sp. NPDC048636 TaxID=3155762 RepID=UPI00342E84AE